jgi:hypothetical protein
MQKEQLVIIGSGIAGFTAAIYASRANLNPLVLSGLPLDGGGGVLGGQLTTTTEVENFPGFEHGIQGPELMSTVQKQAERFGTRVVQDHVVSVDFSKRPFTLKTTNGTEISAEAVVISTGASAKYLGLPNEKRLLGHGVSACATCDGFFFRGRPKYLALAPVEMTTASALISVPLEVFKVKGRLLKSTLTTWSCTTRVPNRSACFCTVDISSGPWMPCSKPGKFSTSVVVVSWPPSTPPPPSSGKPLSTRGFRLARLA